MSDLIKRLREYGGRNTIHPHSGVWMQDAAAALEAAHARIAALESQIAAVEKQEPVAKVVAVDEYGPRIEWTRHWVDFIGSSLYATPLQSEGLRKDAERYRWLRAEHFPTAANPPLAQVAWKASGNRHSSKWVNMIDGHDLDSAIDAALAQQRKEKE